MASDGCRSCGAALPDAAAFCPRCGSAVDSVAVLPLVGEAPVQLDDADDEPSRSGRTLVGAVVGVILVLVVLSTLSGGDGDGDGGPASTTSTTRPRSTTTDPGATTSPVPASLPPILVGEAVLDPTLGMAMLATTTDAVVAVDLGTGRQAVLPTPSDQRPHQVVWTGEVLLARTGTELHRLVSSEEGAATWVPVDVSGWRVDWLDRGGTMVLGGPTASAVMTYAHVGADGDTVVLPLDDELVTQSTFSGLGGLGGLVDGRLIVSTFDGIYAVDPAPGEGASRIASGRLLAVASRRVLRFGCDDRLSCGVAVLDAPAAGATWTERALPPLPMVGDYWLGGLSSDGTRAWVYGFGWRGVGEMLHVFDGERWFSIEAGVAQTPMYQWTDDGTGLLWIDAEDGEVRVVAVGGPRSGATTGVAFDREGLVSTENGEVGVLVPLSGLPGGLFAG